MGTRGRDFKILLPDMIDKNIGKMVFYDTQIPLAGCVAFGIVIFREEHRRAYRVWWADTGHRGTWDIESVEQGYISSQSHRCKEWVKFSEQLRRP